MTQTHREAGRGHQPAVVGVGNLLDGLALRGLVLFHSGPDVLLPSGLGLGEGVAAGVGLFREVFPTAVVRPSATLQRER